MDPRHAVDGRGRVRDANHSAVYEHLCTAGPSSRAELARELSLSAASVSRIANALITAGLVREGERVTSGIGRPQTLLHIRPDAALVVGVSVRSRKVRIHVADLEGTVLQRARVDRADQPRALARQVHEQVRAITGGRPIGAVAVGISGVWDASGKRVFAAPNLPTLQGVDLLTLFRDAFESDVDPHLVTLDNDVNLAALGEREHGSARGVDDFFYLSLGSGVGGAVVLDGRIHRGGIGFAGELGYLPVEVDGERRPLESLVGRAALERLLVDAGRPLRDDDVFASLEASTADGEVVARHVGPVLARALVSVVTVLDPRMIVLGGGVGRFGAAWSDAIERRLARMLPVAPAVVGTTIGREASLLGAVASARVAARRHLVTRLAHG